MDRTVIWMRWQYASGVGKAHAVAAVDAAHEAVLLACGRIRGISPVIGPRPADDQCCTTCCEFDDMRTKWGGHEDLGIPTIDEPVLVRTGGKAADQQEAL